MVSPSPAHSGSSIWCMSGMVDGSASVGSPGHTHTYRWRSTTGNDGTDALGLSVSCAGSRVQRPAGL